MKLFGSVTEFVATVFKKNSQAITLRPNQTTTYTAARDIQLPEGDAVHVIVSRTSTDTLTNKTLTSPVINTPTGIVKGDVGLGNVDNTSDATKNAASVTLTNKTLTSPVIGTDSTYANQAIAKFAEQTGNGTNYIGFSAPDAVTANKVFKLPDGDGSTGQVLKTDGSLNLGWASAVTDPTTTRGDLIRRGASALERFAAVTNNRVVRGDGTDVVLGQIDNTGFFTTGAISVPGTSPGIISANGVPGRADNTAVPAGYIGETIVTNLSGTAVTVTGDTYVDHGTTITPAAGRWEITMQTTGELDYNGASGTFTRFQALYAIREGSNVLSTQYMAGFLNSTVTTVRMPISMTTTIDTDGSKTYKLSVLCDAATASAAAAVNANGTGFFGTNGIGTSRWTRTRKA
jgi:hypothetical protein